MKRIGDLLLGRFLPKVDAHAACCGSCCCIAYQCRRNGTYCLYTCYAETFEGCFSYSQVWRFQGPYCA